ncbi:hypothetical protein [Jeotgalibacillus aurantiacus]|nr:hypothetical protein [Jeotgalibacillus aurantiacus]
MNEANVRTILETMKQYKESGITQSFNAGQGVMLLVSYAPEEDLFVFANPQIELQQKIATITDAVTEIIAFTKDSFRS